MNGLILKFDDVFVRNVEVFQLLYLFLLDFVNLHLLGLPVLLELLVLNFFHLLCLLAAFFFVCYLLLQFISML